MRRGLSLVMMLVMLVAACSSNSATSRKPASQSQSNSTSTSSSGTSTSNGASIQSTAQRPATQPAISSSSTISGSSANSGGTTSSMPTQTISVQTTATTGMSGSTMPVMQTATAGTSVPTIPAMPTTTANVKPTSLSQLQTASVNNHTDKASLAYQSRSDLRPPVINVTTSKDGIAPGYIFIAPKSTQDQGGPFIVDNDGNPVWFMPLGNGLQATDFKVQTYNGQPVLTWWQGKIDKGHGKGEDIIMDSSYRRIATVKAGHGFGSDLHEFVISPQNTALVTVYGTKKLDLTSVGGSKDSLVLDGIVQEIDIKTGRVLFEWHSIDHVGLAETYVPMPKDTTKEPWDYFHINSINVDKDNNLIISARNTDAIYKIDRKTGNVIWRLGGKKSDFQMGPGTRTAFQHDAQMHGGNLISIYDDGAEPPVHKESRGILVKLDTDNMKATLVKAYTSPETRLSGFEGNMQVLPHGNVLLGYGEFPIYTEFDKDGNVVYDANFINDKVKREDTYRAFRFEWNGNPTDKPAVVAKADSNGKATVYVSWNGATNVDRWVVIAGASSNSMKPIGYAKKTGFETPIKTNSSEQYFAVQALDKDGKVLSTSDPVRLKS